MNRRPHARRGRQRGGTRSRRDATGRRLVLDPAIVGARDVMAVVGFDELPDAATDDATRLAALRKAHLIGLSYFPEQSVRTRSAADSRFAPTPASISSRPACTIRSSGWRDATRRCSISGGLRTAVIGKGPPVGGPFHV
jgi:hypothetical protein